jgi:DNA-binding XRE family transcriptional regulator
MTPKPIDFGKVEALRQHMLMTAGQMAQVLGVSRMTYYNWLRGKPVSKANGDTARQAIRNLIFLMSAHQWPSEEVTQLSSAQRHERLLALLAER